MASTLGTDADLLIDLINRSPMLEELRRGTRQRDDLERRLDISSATYYRYLNWLNDRGLVDELSKGMTLTESGEAIAKEVNRFEQSVVTALQLSDKDRDLLLDVARYARGLDALANGPRDRRALERELDVSKTTGYRLTRFLEDNGLIERSQGGYALTDQGEDIRDAVAASRRTVQAALRLGPVLERVRDRSPDIDLEAFADATVTTARRGDPHSPVSRCIELVEATETLRGVYVGTIIPLYISDIGQRIVDGMETVNVGSPVRIAEVLAEAPAKCHEVCASGHLTIYLHDDLSFGLVILDDRVGIGIPGTDTARLQIFVDTDSPEAREWAETVFDSYKSEAVEMDGFSPWDVRQALERGSLDIESLSH